jgi:hypothetical protein
MPYPFPMQQDTRGMFPLSIRYTGYIDQKNTRDAQENCWAFCSFCHIFTRNSFAWTNLAATRL